MIYIRAIFIALFLCENFTKIWKFSIVKSPV